jgi:uncharacterized protein Yka (UPF0111/DUF47 family)
MDRVQIVEGPALSAEQEKLEKVLEKSTKELAMASSLRVLERQYESLKIDIERMLYKIETLDKFISLHANDLKDVHVELKVIKDVIGEKAFKRKK